MKILFITNVPYPYTVSYLSELGKKCELVALFERPTSSERDRSWADFEFTNCRARIMSGINFGVESSICFEVISHIRKEKADMVLISNPCTPTGLIEQAYMRLKKIPYCIQSEGAFVGHGWGIKERVKKYVMEKAVMYFSTGKCQDEYFLKYGAKVEQIRRFPFTSLWNNEISKEIVSIEEKEIIKSKLGVNEEIVIICVGRFVPGKGIDILLKAMTGVKKKVKVLVVGGEPTEEYLEICKRGKLDNVQFISHISKEKLLLFYKASDLFVLPTYSDTWGLVIVEAMSNGLPVISTDRCVAACTLLENGRNGYVLPVGDIEAFRAKIELLVENKELLIEMGKNALDDMQNYSIEEMANSVMAGMNELVNN